MPEQKIEQIKRDPTKEVQKINLGWRGYIPGYKDRWVKQTNAQINQSAERINENTGRLARLPGGPIERPAGFQHPSGESGPGPRVLTNGTKS